MASCFNLSRWLIAGTPETNEFSGKFLYTHDFTAMVELLPILIWSKIPDCPAIVTLLPIVLLYQLGKQSDNFCQY